MVGLAALASDVATGYSTAARWVGWWPSTWNAFQDFDRFGAVIAAGCAAYLTSGARRFGLGEWGRAAVRSTGNQSRSIMLTVLITMTLAHLTGFCLLAMATTLRGATPGADALWLNLPTVMCSTAFWTGGAIILARRLPPVFSLALAVVAPYLTTVWLDAYGLDTPVAVFTIANSGNYLTVAPSTVTLIVRLAAWGALALLIGVGVARARGWRRHTAQWFASVTVAAAVYNGLAWTPIVGADALVCQGSAPKVCLTRPFASELGTFASLVRSVWPLLPSDLRTTMVLSPEAAGVGRRGAMVVGPVNGNDESAMILDRRQTIARIGEAAWPLPDLRCSDPRYLLTRNAFQVWWRRRYHLPLDGSNFPGEIAYGYLDDSAAVGALATRLEDGGGGVRLDLVQAYIGPHATCFAR